MALLTQRLTGRPREPPGSGKFGVWIIVDSVTGPSTSDASCSSHAVASSSRFVGGLSVWTWRYEPSALHPGPPVDASGAGVGGASAVVFGHIVYQIEDVWEIDGGMEVPGGFEWSSPVSGLRLSNMCSGCSIVGGAMSVHEFENASEVDFNIVFRFPCRIG